MTKSAVCVRYAETDQMGVAHHSVYPIWFELARTDFIKVIGVTYSSMEEMGILLPVAELNVRYRLPAKYEDELIVETHIERITPARIVFGYKIYRKDDMLQNAMVVGSTTHGWVDKSMRPMNMKKAHPELYAQIAALAEY